MIEDMKRTRLLQVLITEEDYRRLWDLLSQTNDLSRRTVSTLVYEQAIRPWLDRRAEEKTEE